MADEYSDFAPTPMRNLGATEHTREHNPAPDQHARHWGRHAPEPEQKEEDEDGEVEDHFAELAAAVDQAHEQLVEMGSPYRFCIYREDGEVYIDIILVDKDGHMLRDEKRRITHEQFYRWMDAIERGEGLFFEGTA